MIKTQCDKTTLPIMQLWSQMHARQNNREDSFFQWRSLTEGKKAKTHTKTGRRETRKAKDSNHRGAWRKIILTGESKKKKPVKLLAYQIIVRLADCRCVKAFRWALKGARLGGHLFVCDQKGNKWCDWCKYTLTLKPFWIQYYTNHINKPVCLPTVYKSLHTLLSTPSQH